MAGLFCCGTSRLLSDKWVANARTALGAGIVLGAAYLAKAVALPLSGLIIIALAGINVAVYQSSLRRTVRAATIIVAGFLIIAGPWIGILSYKYRRPVFSSIGPIQHTLAGPPDMFRGHPDKLHFYKPETGRFTTLEDRTNLPYNYLVSVCERCVRGPPGEGHRPQCPRNSAVPEEPRLVRLGACLCHFRVLLGHPGGSHSRKNRGVCRSSPSPLWRSFICLFLRGSIETRGIFG